MKTNQRILVVDDESVLCDVLRINLELAGYKVDTATSAEEALRLDLSVYDMLILDVMMDKMNGFDLASDYHRYTPISIDDVEWFANAMKYWDKNVYSSEVQA